MHINANFIYETSTADHIHHMLSSNRYKQSASEVETAIKNHFFQLLLYISTFQSQNNQVKNLHTFRAIAQYSASYEINAIENR